MLYVKQIWTCVCVCVYRYCPANITLVKMADHCVCVCVCHGLITLNRKEDALANRVAIARKAKVG